MIRRMINEDIPEVAAIERLCFSQPWSEKGFMEGLEASAVFLVAEEDSRIAGYIGMYISAPEGEITNVAVAPEFRGKGIGTELVDAMKLWAFDHDVTRIVLEVRVSNAAAIHIYESAGFVKLGIRKAFYQFPTEDAFVMEMNQ